MIPDNDTLSLRIAERGSNRPMPRVEALATDIAQKCALLAGVTQAPISDVARLKLREAMGNIEMILVHEDAA